MQTTFLKLKDVMSRRDIEHCHNGCGAIHCLGVLNGDDPGGDRVRFMHDDVLPPNSSIGVHTHVHDTEYYYVVSGTGVMTLDGREHEVSTGDITMVFPGGSHGLANRSDQDLRIIVISVCYGNST